jgi:regulator of protease activity HflC (stomatin/prohibitin superfamily)
MQDRILKALIFIVVAVGFLVYSTFFIVKETHQAIVLQLGRTEKSL